MSAWTETILQLCNEGSLDLAVAAVLAEKRGSERTGQIQLGLEHDAITHYAGQKLLDALRDDVVGTKPRRRCICTEGPDRVPWHVLDQKEVEHVAGCWKLSWPVVPLAPPPGWSWCDTQTCRKAVTQGSSCRAGDGRVIHADGGCGATRNRSGA